MALPSNVSYGHVTGRFLRAIADSSDTDLYPDGQPLAGLTIKFTASVTRVKNITTTPPVTIIIDPIVGVTNGNGVLVDSNGNEGVWLVASSDKDLNPTGWTWTATFSAPYIDSFTTTFTLAPDQEVDLTTLIPVPSSPGTELAAWEAVVAGVAADAQAAQAAAQQALENAGKVPAGAIGTDQLAANAVTSAKVTAGAIGTDQLAANAVTSAKLANGAVGSSQLAAAVTQSISDAQSAAAAAQSAITSLRNSVDNKFASPSAAVFLPTMYFATKSELTAFDTTDLKNGQKATVTSDSNSANNGDYVWSGSAWVKRGRVFEWLDTYAGPYADTGQWKTETSQTLTIPAGLYQFTIGKRHWVVGEGGAEIELLQGSTVKYRFEWTSQYHEIGTKNDWASMTMQVVAGQYTVRVQSIQWQDGFSTAIGLCTINGVDYSRVATIDML